MVDERITIAATSGPRPVVLTGATGFIGRAVLAQLVELGIPVRALAHRAASVRSDVPVEWHVGDIRDHAMWHRLLPGAGAIIHLASAGVADLNAVTENVETNLLAFAAMMRAAHQQQLRRVILAGSCFEYGRAGESILDRGLRESDPLCPTNVYAATKASVTLLAGPLSDDLELETVVLRPFHVYGVDEPAERLIPAVLNMARAGSDICTTSGEQIRDLVHLTDVARAFVAAVSAPSVRDNDDYLSIFNVGTGLATSLADVIRRLVTLCELKPERLQLGAVPYRPREMWRLVADPTRARVVLGWTPRITLDEGLRALVAKS